jgi:hypothetical protein
LATPVWAIDGYVLGGGVESDSGDGLAAAVIVDIGFSEKTWISASAGINTADLPNGSSLNTQNSSIGIDHWFKPLGINLDVAYWGDDEILDSVDLRGSLYWRNDKLTISLDYERRDFDFNIPRTDLFPGRSIGFDSTGVGLSARFKLTDALSVNLTGIDYDYSVNLALDSNRGIVQLLSVSRLSLINSLIDSRVGAGVSLDVGERNWSLDYRSWEGAVDGSETTSATLRFLTPLGQRSDIEFGLGVDNSDRFGSVTFLSVFLFFYGGS